VKTDVDCQVFEDQLDALVRGDLPAEGMRQLRAHAGACAGCAMELKVQEHLSGPSLEELEARVPEELLGTVWDGVRRDMDSRAADSVRVAPFAGPSRPFFRWLVPTLAAATVALLLSTGFLAMETRRLTDETASLAQQVKEQRRWMAELEATTPSTDPVARTAALAGRSSFTRALSREENISIVRLQSLLERMPGDRMVVSQDQVDAVLRSRAGLSQPLIRELLAGIDARDGVRVRDLIRALDALEVGPGFMVPTADLMEILS